VYLRLLQIRDIDDVNAYLALVAHAERIRGRLDAVTGFGSDIAPDLVGRSTAAALRLADRASDAAAADGYGDVLRLVMDHSGEVPFAESQIKYFHSLLLRHDPTAAGHRRHYRGVGAAPIEGGAWAVGEAPAAERAAAEMPRLVAWTREALETELLHPLLTIGLFLGRFLVLRPFAAGNTRLALALAVYLLDSYGYEHVRYASVEEVFDERRDAGAAALAEAAGEREDVTPWVRFVVDAVCESERRALERLSPGSALRLTPRQTRLLEAMRERKAAKIGDLLPLLATPRATLKKDLRALVDAGYLVSEGVRKGTVYHIRQ
jgi:Fic family protein